MAKAVIITCVVLSTILVAGVILSLVAPKRISISSSTIIHASKQEVFDHLRFMRKFPKWSPFRLQDPKQKFAISGTDGEVGATFSWEGVSEKSKGSQKIVTLKGNEAVTIQCNITEPFNTKPIFTYTLNEKNGGVEVVQHFYAEMPVPTNIFALVFGVKNKIATTNKQGLHLLKQITEANETASLNTK